MEMVTMQDTKYTVYMFMTRVFDNLLFLINISQQFTIF